MVAKPTDSDSPARSRQRTGIMTSDEWADMIATVTDIKQSLKMHSPDMEQLKREGSSRSDHVHLLGSRVDSLECVIDQCQTTVTHALTRIDGFLGQSNANADSMVQELRGELETMRIRMSKTESTVDARDQGLKTMRDHDQAQLDGVRAKVNGIRAQVAHLEQRVRSGGLQCPAPEQSSQVPFTASAA